MSDSESGYVAIAAMVVISLLFQTQLKLLAIDVSPILARTELPFSQRLGPAVSALLCWRTAAILIMAGALFALWFAALMKLDLSVALPLASIVLVVNAIGGGLILGEPMSWMRILGTLTVAGGIALVIGS
jgi:drug/metabolite transporter (DMT)-like permease